MPIPPFGWTDTPSTPLSAEELEAFEQHIGQYVDSQVGTGGLTKQQVVATGLSAADIYADASGAAAAVSSSSIQRQLITGSVTVGSGPAQAGAHNLFSASAGAASAFLPTPSASGSVISVEKVDSSASAVTVVGSIRGAAASISLVLPHETILLESDSGGSWWPIAGHKTLSSLDSRYVQPSQLPQSGVSGSSPLSKLPLSAAGLAGSITPNAGLLTASAGAVLAIPTGFAGNDVVEPAVLWDPSAPFLGYEYVLCASPYYQSSATYENPCLWVSHDGNAWIPLVNGVPTPAGTVTPVAPNGVQGDGNLSDSYLCIGPDGTYYVFFNQFLNATPGGTGTGGNNWSVKGMSASSLAGPWTGPTTVLATVLATTRPSSPSIFWDAANQLWHMYCVDEANTAATIITHYTNPNASPLAGTWTQQANPSIPVPSAYSSQEWWHLNAYKWGSLHALLIEDTPTSSPGAGGNLWLATSPDAGTTWTVPAQPLLSGQSAYRSAMVPTRLGYADGFDLFYGTQGANWQLRRTTASFSLPAAKYGGLSLAGIPINTEAVALARIPIPPYAFGDTAIRAASTTSPGTADSGQAYTVASGVVGIINNQLYTTTGGNNKAVVTGLTANGVYSYEFSALDGATASYAIARYVDASNFVRVGYTGGNYVLQNIVAGAISQSVTCTLPTGVIPASGDVIALVCNGNTITVYVNGIQAAQATGWSSNNAGTGIGVQPNGTNARFRNVTFRPLIQGA